MKIHLINPNTSQHMTEQMQESAQAVANASTEIVGRTPKHGAVSIESHFDEAMSIVGVAEEIRQADSEGADGMIVACFGDPNIWAVRELTDASCCGAQVKTVGLAKTFRDMRTDGSHPIG